TAIRLPTATAANFFLPFIWTVPSVAVYWASVRIPALTATIAGKPWNSRRPRWTDPGIPPPARAHPVSRHASRPIRSTGPRTGDLRPWMPAEAAPYRRRSAGRRRPVRRRRGGPDGFRRDPVGGMRRGDHHRRAPVPPPSRGRPPRPAGRRRPVSRGRRRRQRPVPGPGRGLRQVCRRLVPALRPAHLAVAGRAAPRGLDRPAHRVRGHRRRTGAERRQANPGGLRRRHPLPRRPAAIRLGLLPLVAPDDRRAGDPVARRAPNPGATPCGSNLHPGVAVP